MDFFVKVIPQGQILNSKLKLVKQQAKKKTFMTAKNFLIAPFSPVYTFSPPPPFASLRVFAPPSLLKSPPFGRFAPL